MKTADSSTKAMNILHLPMGDYHPRDFAVRLSTSRTSNPTASAKLRELFIFGYRRLKLEPKAF
jgi:hypothetical protein